jgi:hypothetical protein
MSNITARRIPEPADNTRTVLRTDNEDPIMVGEGDISYLCECGHVLARNVVRGQISNIVFQCFNCGAFSEVL